MKLLVLGAGGQLGGDVIDAAKGTGITALPATRADVDVTDRDALARFLTATPFDALLNTTSYHKTDEVEAHADRAMDVNAHAPVVMAAVCAEKKARFLHISTDYVFGGDTGRTTPLTETAAPAPVNVYGLSKLFGETLIGLGNRDATIFRVASLFGRRGASGKGGNFVETMIRFGREKGALKVVDDQVMSPTATAWIARAVLTFLEKDGAPGLYHCVNSGAVSWAGFARAIMEGAGIDATVTGITSAEWPTPARRPAYSALDNGRLAGIIGPIPPWQDALAGYLAARPGA